VGLDMGWREWHGGMGMGLDGSFERWFVLGKHGARCLYPEYGSSCSLGAAQFQLGLDRNLEQCIALLRQQKL
jgi:hypothetical protein